MNVIFTCGGTGGHINPAIAVANMMKERHPECNILFIGAKGHMEEQLVPKAGYRLECLPGSGLSRGKNLAALKKNAKAVKCVLDAVNQCKKIIQCDCLVQIGTRLFDAEDDRPVFIDCHLGDGDSVLRCFQQGCLSAVHE